MTKWLFADELSVGWRSSMALVAMLALMTTGTRGAYAQGSPSGQGPAARGAHVDKKLADLLGKKAATDRVRVIVTTKRGAKAGLLNAVLAQGANRHHDFAMIEAFSGEVPVARLRELKEHQDVVALSIDEPLTSFQIAPAVGTVYTVTNTNNSGAGSLRQAIADANGHAGADTIWFNIPLTDPNHVYYRNNATAGTFSTPVPTTKADSAITDFDTDYISGTARSWYRISLSGSAELSVTGPVVIDGTTQPGYSVAGGPVIEINAAGVTASDPNAISLTTGASTIKGLVINRAGDDGIEIDTGAGGSIITGNYIGTDVSGTQALGNGYGLSVKSNGNVIGGSQPGSRNVISGNNRSSESWGIGFYNSASGNIVQGNYIGSSANGAKAVPNSRSGIEIYGSAAQNLIGGVGAGEGNVIANNGGDGIFLPTGAGTGNRILGNSIFANTGSAIDLGANGKTNNDSGDGDSGANNLQNFPVLTKAITTGTLVEITGTLNSTANSYFRLEFFSNATADSTGHGEGQVYLGSTNVATGSTGNAAFRATLNAAVASGSVISATATKSTSSYAAFTDTSEFAANVTAALVPANVLATKSVRGTLGLDSLTSTAPLTTRTGAGVTVAVIDSGMILDGGAASRLKTTRDFTTGNPNPPHIGAVDGYGHGTHVAGLIGANQAELQGVASGVSFVSLRVLDNYGVGLTSNLIAALQWAVANKAAYGIDIINLSLGHPIFEPAATDPLVQAVEAAVRAHIVVVVSAGNYGTNPFTSQVGYAGISSPGNARSAITVGAIKTFDTAARGDDLVADYSSRGPTWYDAYAKPEVVAPGHRLLAAAATNQTLYTLFPAMRRTVAGRPYLTLSGTSMAAGVVSGSVALMIEEAKGTFGAAPPASAIKAMLQASAFPMKDATLQPYHLLVQGAGALNTAGALTLAHAINPTMSVGSYWLVSAVTKSTTIDGQNLFWGDNIIWGENIVWGDSVKTNNVIWGDNIIWGSNVTWGSNTVWRSNIVWGDNFVWGNNLVWGSNIVWGDNIICGDNIVWGDVTSTP